MRERQRKKSKYRLPDNLYMQMIYMIRDYDTFNAEAEAILDESKIPPDGQPKGDEDISEPERKAMRREKCLQIVKAIDDAKAMIPEEYRQGVWNSVMYREPYPNDAAKGTYGKYKSLFVFKVARNLGYV